MAKAKDRGIGGDLITAHNSGGREIHNTFTHAHTHTQTQREREREREREVRRYGFGIIGAAQFHQFGCLCYDTSYTRCA